MKITRLLMIAAIVACTAMAWFLLGSALTVRSSTTAQRLGPEVAGNLGSEMAQSHPTIYYLSSTRVQAKRVIQPIKSVVEVDLHYTPRKKGLIWFRAYDADFQADYSVQNPTPIRQTIYVDFRFPSEGARYDKFALTIGEKKTDKVPVGGRLTESVILDPGETRVLHVAYQSSGQNQWSYDFGDSRRVRDFSLALTSDFDEINMPMGTESPTTRDRVGEGWELKWDYSDVIGANSIGMDMPAVVNPGPVAARIIFFAPISLLFFFAVLVILGMVKGVDLHPMNYFFLAAGCFSFQLLFAYLVDHLALMSAFAIAAVVSLILVSGYLGLVAGMKFARLAAVAQFIYMVLFSYSFFFQGFTGITITIGAIVTLALLMGFTAKVDWSKIFVRKSGRASAHPASSPAVPPPLT
jgi:hypothetical protein